MYNSNNYVPDSPKSKPHYPKPGTELSLKPTAPPLSEIEPQQHSIPAAPSAPPLNDLHSGGKSLLMLVVR